jgi:hypothetical protein
MKNSIKLLINILKLYGEGILTNSIEYYNINYGHKQNKLLIYKFQ